VCLVILLIGALMTTAWQAWSGLRNIKRVNEKFDQLYEYEQGGITYLKIALDKISQ
jgi:hypothetical protein